jgi:hypothetical protein
MLIDIHVHTSLSRSLPFSQADMLAQVARARQQGLGACALTDHSDAADILAIHDALDASFPWRQHAYDADGVWLFPGVEVDVAEGVHLLAIGGREAIRRFIMRLVPGIDAAGYFAAQADLALFNVIAHPLRPGHELTRLPPALLPRFDALDLNAKDLWRAGPEHHAAMLGLSARHGLPLLAGSDAHHPDQLGAVRAELSQPVTSPAGLRDSIRHAPPRLHIHPELRAMVAAAREAKARRRAAGC